MVGLGELQRVYLLSAMILHFLRLMGDGRQFSCISSSAISAIFLRSISRKLSSQCWRQALPQLHHGCRVIQLWLCTVLCMGRPTLKRGSPVAIVKMVS